MSAMGILLTLCTSVVGLSLAAQARATDSAASYNRRGQSSFVERDGGGHDSFRVTNITYAVTETSIDALNRDQKLLLEQKSVSNQDWDTETSTPDLTVSARLIAAGRFKKPLWSFKERADRGEIWNKYYRTTVLAGADGEDLNRYHDLATGRIAFLSTTEPIFVELANRKFDPFIITYISNKTGDNFSFVHRNPGAFALLVLRQGAKVIDRVVLVSETGAMEGWSPKAGAADLMARDPGPPDGQPGLTLFRPEGTPETQAWNGLEIRLRFDAEIDQPLIVIPVKDKRFAIENVALPKGVTLRRDAPGKGGALDP